MAALLVEIEGRELPGRRCACNPAGDGYDNVHVYLGRRNLPRDLVPGDAPAARWQLEVSAKADGAGGFDFGGPLVQGKRGERFLALYWGTVAEDGTFTLFRGAKLRFADIDPPTLLKALLPGKLLIGRLGLTDAKGNPRCASIRPPDVQWSVGSR
ncbi:MAG: DUF5990 family protein [Chloroflexota bacterium]